MKHLHRPLVIIAFVALVVFAIDFLTGGAVFNPWMRLF